MRCAVYIACCVGLLLGGGGCKSVPREAGFPDVRREVDARIHQHVRWNALDDSACVIPYSELLKEPLTRERAVQIALLSNPRLQATYEDLGIAQAGVVQSRLWRNPRISASWLPPISGGGASLAGLELAQNLVDLVFVGARKKEADAHFRGTKARITLRVLEIAAETEVAYVRLQASEQLVELTRKSAEAAAASLLAAQRLHQAGNAPKLTLLIEQAAEQEARQTFSRAQTEADVQRLRLARLMGLVETNTPTWPEIEALPLLPADEPRADDLLEQGLANNLNLAAKRADIDALAQRHRIKKYESVLSEMELGIAAEREDDRAWFVGPSFNWEIPVFDQGQAKRFRARAEFRQALAEYASLLLETRAASKTAVLALARTYAQAKSSESELLPLQHEIMGETLKQHNAMQVGVFQVLEAKRQQLRVEQQQIENLRSYWLAQIRSQYLVAGLVLPAETPKDSEALDQ